MRKSERERLSDEAIANKRKYDQNYLKENYKLFAVGLLKEEYEELKWLIKENGISNVEFVRIAMRKLQDNDLI